MNAALPARTWRLTTLRVLAPLLGVMLIAAVAPTASAATPVALGSLEAYTMDGPSADAQAHIDPGPWLITAPDHEVDYTVQVVDQLYPLGISEGYKRTASSLFILYTTNSDGFDSTSSTKQACWWPQSFIDAWHARYGTVPPEEWCTSFTPANPSLHAVAHYSGGTTSDHYVGIVEAEIYEEEFEPNCGDIKLNFPDWPCDLWGNARLVSGDGDQGTGEATVTTLGLPGIPDVGVSAFWKRLEKEVESLAQVE